MSSLSFSKMKPFSCDSLLWFLHNRLVYSCAFYVCMYVLSYIIVIDNLRVIDDVQYSNVWVSL